MAMKSRVSWKPQAGRRSSLGKEDDRERGGRMSRECAVMAEEPLGGRSSDLCAKARVANNTDKSCCKYNKKERSKKL